MILPSSDFYPQSNPDSILEIQDFQQEHSPSTSQGSTSASVYSVSTNKAVDIPVNLQSYRILSVKTHVTGSTKPDVMTYDASNSSFNGAYFDKRATESTVVSSKIAEITQAQSNMGIKKILSNQSEILPNSSLSKTFPTRLSSPPNSYLSYQHTALGYTPGSLNTAPPFFFDGGFQSLHNTKTTQASSSSIQDLQLYTAGQKQLNYSYLADPSPPKLATPTQTTVPTYIPLTYVKSSSFQELKKHLASQVEQRVEVEIPSKSEQLSEQSFLEEDIRMCNLI